MFMQCGQKAQWLFISLLIKRPHGIANWETDDYKYGCKAVVLRNDHDLKP
jgi:hypothetical protein